MKSGVLMECLSAGIKALYAIGLMSSLNVVLLRILEREESLRFYVLQDLAGGYLSISKIMENLDADLNLL